MALTPEEVKRMEEQADLSDRFNRAADRYVAGNNPGLRAAEREQVLRGREADVFSAARQRRINANRDIAASDPGRFSAFETRSLLGLQHTQGGDIARNDIDERSNLRQHELDMLKQTGENEFKVAEQKRLGMKEQGSNAAGLNAEATKYGWNKQLKMEQKRQEGLTEREKMIGDRTERIAGMEHGTIGPNGTVTPGSRERVATITGKSAVQQQAEANKGLAAQAEINRQKQQEQIAAQIQRSIIAAGGKADAAKIAGHAKIVGEALRNGSMVGKDAATVMAELAEQYKDDPEMLKSIQSAGGQQQAAPATGSNIEKGTRKTFPNGQTGMWDGTKWVPVS